MTDNCSKSESGMALLSCLSEAEICAVMPVSHALFRLDLYSKCLYLYICVCVLLHIWFQSWHAIQTFSHTKVYDWCSQLQRWSRSWARSRSRKIYKKWTEQIHNSQECHHTWLKQDSYSNLGIQIPSWILVIVAWCESDAGSRWKRWGSFYSLFTLIQNFSASHIFNYTLFQHICWRY